jgi:hypothetical protein
VPQKLPKNESALAAAEAQWLKVNTAGAKARIFRCHFGTTEVVPCYKTFPEQCFPQADWLVTCNDSNAIALGFTQLGMVLISSPAMFYWSIYARFLETDRQRRGICSRVCFQPCRLCGVCAWSLHAGIQRFCREVAAILTCFPGFFAASILAFWKRRIAGLAMLAFPLIFVAGMLDERRYMLNVRHFPQEGIPTLLQEMLLPCLPVLILGAFAFLTGVAGWAEVIGRKLEPSAEDERI